MLEITAFDRSTGLALTNTCFDTITPTDHEQSAEKDCRLGYQT